MKKISTTALGALMVLAACSDGPTALAPDVALEKRFSSMQEGPVTYTGQGTYLDGDGIRVLGEEICGLENGAESDDPYLLWILTANGAESATITFPWGTETMEQAGGGNSVFKFVSDYYDLDSLIGIVTAEYVGSVRGSVQLVISHGCPPNGGDVGAWCSPGYWRNAKDAAWEQTGHPKTTLFNGTVYNYWFGAPLGASVTLGMVLDASSTYSGPPNAGTSGHELNAFNAVGAMLTDALDGYYFDPDLMGVEGACPLNNAGEFED